MENGVLVIDNDAKNFEAVQKEWLKHQISIKTVKSMPEALKLLTKIDFLLIAIVADNIEYMGKVGGR